MTPTAEPPFQTVARFSRSKRRNFARRERAKEDERDERERKKTRETRSSTASLPCKVYQHQPYAIEERQSPAYQQHASIGRGATHRSTGAPRWDSRPPYHWPHKYAHDYAHNVGPSDHYTTAGYAIEEAFAPSRRVDETARYNGMAGTVVAGPFAQGAQCPFPGGYPHAGQHEVDQHRVGWPLEHPPYRVDNGSAFCGSDWVPPHHVRDPSFGCYADHFGDRGDWGQGFHEGQVPFGVEDHLWFDGSTYTTNADLLRPGYEPRGGPRSTTTSTPDHARTGGIIDSHNSSTVAGAGVLSRLEDGLAVGRDLQSHPAVVSCGGAGGDRRRMDNAAEARRDAGCENSAQDKVLNPVLHPDPRPKSDEVAGKPAELHPADFESATVPVDNEDDRQHPLDSANNTAATTTDGTTWQAGEIDWPLLQTGSGRQTVCPRSRSTTAHKRDSSIAEAQEHGRRHSAGQQRSLCTAHTEPGTRERNRRGDASPCTPCDDSAKPKTKPGARKPDKCVHKPEHQPYHEPKKIEHKRPSIDDVLLEEGWRAACGPVKCASLTKRHRKTKVASRAECEEFDLHAKPTSRANTFRILQVCPELQDFLLWNSSADRYRSAATGPNRYNKGSTLTPSDLARLLRLGYIERIDPHDVQRLGVAFTVVEDKDTGKRRRFILWPQQLNDEISLAFPESNFSGSTPFDVLADVHSGSFARCYDLRVGFWQLKLSKKVSAYHAFRVGNDYYAMGVMAMGAMKSPEVLHELTRSLGEVAIRRAAKDRPGLKVAAKTHIDNIRFVGSQADVDAVGAHFEQLCAWCNISLNVEAENTTHSRGKFLGVQYDYEAKRVHLTSKMVEKLRDTKISLFASTPTAETIMSAHGLLQYTSTILQAPLHEWYGALKFVRRVSSKLFTSSIAPSTPTPLWTEAAEHLRRWCDFCIANTPVTPLRSLDGIDATLFSDASLSGLGAVLVAGGTVQHYGRRWTAEEIEANTQTDHRGERRPNIAALELLAGQVAVEKFSDHLCDQRVHYVTDSTTGLGALRKSRSKSELLNQRVSGVKAALAKARPRATVATYIVTSENPADLPSRQNSDTVTLKNLARRACAKDLWRNARSIPTLRAMTSAA